MPQFETTFFVSQIFWTIVSFVILFFLLNRWVIPLISKMLQQRAQQIENNLKHAEESRHEAELLKTIYFEKIANIQQESKKMIAEAESLIAQKREKSMDELESKLQRKKEIFLADQEQLHKKTMQEMKNESSALIVSAAEQLIHHHFSQEEAQQELDDIIATLEDELPSKK